MAVTALDGVARSSHGVRNSQNILPDGVAIATLGRLVTLFNVGTRDPINADSHMQRSISVTSEMEREIAIDAHMNRTIETVSEM